MDTTLYYNDLLGLYHSFDWMWIYDPNSQQLYQQVGPGQFQPVQIQQSDPYYPPSYPPSYPQSYPPSYPQAAPQQPPVYVQPPRIGSSSAQPGQPTTPTGPASPRVIVAPAAPPSTQPSSGYQSAPPRRTGSGGSVTTRAPQPAQPARPAGPDPKQGYWQAFNLIGYWQDYADQKSFYQASYPVNKVRLTDGRPWPYGALAIYEGRDAKAGIYFLLYDAANESYEPIWKKASERVRAVQVDPVLPF